MTTTDRIPGLPFLAPRDRRRCITPAEERTAGRYLILGDGIDDELLALDGSAVTVGRGLSVDVSFDDPTVSRRHATLVRHGDRVQLHDDSSTNGTWVNGRRVTSVGLVDGDVIAFGRLVVVFRDATPVALAA